MSRQLLPWGSYSGFAGLSSTTKFNIPGGGSWYSVSIDQETIIVPCAGTLRNFYVHTNVAMGAAKNGTYTLMVNGSASALAITLNGASQQDASDTNTQVTVAAGDRISIQYSTSAAPATHTPQGSIEFESSNSGDSFHGGSSAAVMGAGTTTTQALCGPDSSTFGQGSFIDGSHHSLVATPGTITALYARIDGTLTSGSYVLNLVKNGTVQDGSGGTQTTTVTLQSGAQTAHATFSLSCVAGDDIQLKCVATAPSTSRRVQFGVCFNATTPGLFNICTSAGLGPSTSAVNATQPNTCGDNGVAAAGWGSPVAGGLAVSGINQLKITSLYALASAAPGGAGKSWQLQLRKSTSLGSSSGTDQASSSQTISNAATTAGGSFTAITIDTALNSNGFQTSCTPASTPAAAIISVAFEAQLVVSTNHGKSQAGNHKGGGGAVTTIEPGGTIYINIGNAGQSSQSN